MIEPSRIRLSFRPRVRPRGGNSEPSDARKSPVGREFESYFFGGDCVIAAVRQQNPRGSLRDSQRIQNAVHRIVAGNPR